MIALAISLLLLCGCSDSRQLEENFNAWRTEFSKNPERQITALVTSTQGDAHSEFTLAYERNNGEETVAVLAPELITQIKAHITADGVSLSYDGVVLETGSTLTEGISPLMALPLFMDFLEKGYVKSVWLEKNGSYELVATELELGDGSRMTIWQDESDNTPLYAAIRSGESVQLRIKLTEIT